MKRYVTASVMAIVMAGSPAFASTTANYTMTGTVAAVCTAGAGGTLAFNSLINGSTGATTVTNPTPTADTTAFCNQAQTTVKVQRTDLVATGAVTSAGFTNVLLITSAKVISAQNATGVTDSTATTIGGTGLSAGTSNTLGAFTSLTVSVIGGAGSGGNSLVASNSYAGTVTITLTPTS